MVRVITFICLLMVVCLGSSGQSLRFYTVKKLPASVNSAGEEALPLLSPEGQLFFTRALYAGNRGGKFSGIDIWQTELNGAGWKNATNSLSGGMNDEGHNAIIGISADGKKRYVLNAKSNQRISGIYVSSRNGNYWSRPEPVAIPGIENQSFLGIHVSADSEVILLSMKAPDSRGEEDLYFSLKTSTGEWTTPRNLGPTINTAGYEISPFLSADKKRLYFASNGHGGEGSADIFYSERLYNSWETWSVPVNLGKEVNSKKFDAYFSIYGDSIAYFASNRDGRFADLYEVKVSIMRSVLRPGQRYLSSAESNRELGGAVSREIVFSPGKSALNAAQKELLFYMANKLQLQKSIIFHLVVEEEESQEQTELRLSAIREYLIQSGLSDERVIVEQTEPPAQGSSGRIEIRLIE